MSEQLWYTWSDSGFGTAVGYRVRAASSKLRDVESQRVREFVNLVPYRLSPDTDLYLPPEKAPVCLAFVKAGAQRDAVLIQKTYTGLDGLKRPGTFFSHLITELPPVPSPCREGEVPFSAREAIDLWRSPNLWHKSAESLPANKRDLEVLFDGDLYSRTYGIPSRCAGPLNAQAVLRIPPELFKQVFQAFLTLAISRSESGESKRLYLVGDPDTIAALIWGITHALPRTLSIMRELTFSTFEANIEADPKPLIVGTCWLRENLKKGHENASLDLPPLYYQANNPFGLAIHCDIAGKCTPFSLPHPYISKYTELVSKYTEFVLDSFGQGEPSMDRVAFLLNDAEKYNINIVTTFLDYYINYTEPLTKEAVIKLLENLLNKTETLLTQTETVLQKEKLSEVAAEVAQMGSVQLEVDQLKRPNVQLSILTLIKQESTWWQSQGKNMVKRLCQLALRYTEQQLAHMRESFLTRITSKREWSRDNGDSAIGQVQHLVQVKGTPQEILQAFATAIEQQALVAQRELWGALLPLAKSLADELIKTLWTDQLDRLYFWHEAFLTCVEVPNRGSLLDIWAYLLQQLATENRYTSTYKEWWQRFGRDRLSRLRPYASSGSKFALGFSSLATAVTAQLVASVKANDVSALSLWSGMTEIIAPPASEPDTWASLLNGLGPLTYTSAYEQWWRNSGVARLRDILTLLNQSAESELSKALSSFTRQVSISLQMAIRNPSSAAQAFWGELFVTVAPPISQPYFWTDLLLKLSDVLTFPGFQKWWNDQGSAIVSALRTQAVRDEKILSQLTIFAQAVVESFSAFLLQGQQEHETVGLFLLEVLSASVPGQDGTVWGTLFQKLTNVSAYRSLSWELRAALLRKWQGIASLNDAERQSQLRQWFEVSWDDLEAFLMLGLPVDWQSIAITKALETYHQTTKEKVLSLVKRYPEQVTEVLQTLVRHTRTEQTAIDFFSFLVQYHSTSNLVLLGRMLTTNYRTNHSQLQKDNVAERLLKVAQITDQAMVNLLELHCQDLLATCELSPVLLDMLERYFASFDVDFLDNDHARGLLKRLMEREQQPALRLPPKMQQTVENWYLFAEFLEQSLVDPEALNDLNRLMGNMSVLNSEMQKKLMDKLAPFLVRSATSEGEIAVILFTFGRESRSQLFQEMARSVGEDYGQERPPVRIAPYARLILIESKRLLSPKKEAFLDTCFRSLFKFIDAKTRDKYWPEPLWEPTLVSEWKNILSRQQSEEINKALKSFRKALHDAYVPSILSTFDSRFEGELTLVESTIHNLATNFIDAYNANSDTAILRTHEALQRYIATNPIYKSEQLERIKQAYQLKQQQVSGQPILGTQNVSPSAGGSGFSYTLPSANRLGEPNSIREQQPVLFSHGQTAAPNPPVQSMVAGKRQPAATVNDKPISFALLESAMEIKRIYLADKILQLQKTNQLIENDKAKDKAKKKEFTNRRKEWNDMQELLDDVMELQKAVLDDLIDDLLIRVEVDWLRRVDRTRYWDQFDREIESEIIKLHGQLASQIQAPTSLVKARDEREIASLRDILSIFIRREEFNKYLEAKTQQTETVEGWLKNRRTEKKDSIIINLPNSSKNVIARLIGGRLGSKQKKP